MKEGWTYKKLGEVCDFEGGSQPPKSEWINNPKDGYVRMLQIRDFTKSREVEVEYVKLTKKLRLCKSDDILIGRYGASVGKILTGLEGAYNVAIIKTIPDETQITKGFIRRYFESSNFQQLLQKVCVVRTAQAGFSKDDVNDTLIPIPSIDEQQRIVSRLDSAFAYIDELKANAEKQLSEARALFQRALTKAMEPKEGWEEKTLGKIANVFSGYAFKSGTFQKKGKYQVLRIGNIKQNYLRLSDNAIFIDDIDCGLIKKSLLKDGDLVVTQTGTRHKRDYGFVAMVEKDNLLLNQRNACIRFDNKLNAQFFLYYSYTELYKDSFFANEGGTVGQGNVGLSALKEMTYYAPPLSEQQRIVSRLDSISAHVRELEEVLQKTIAECDALKQALLRKVFE